MWVGGQRDDPTALPLGKAPYPLYMRLVRPQGRSGRVRKILPPPDRPARSESLYRLHYGDPHKNTYLAYFGIKIKSPQESFTPTAAGT